MRSGSPTGKTDRQSVRGHRFRGARKNRAERRSMRVRRRSMGCREQTKRCGLAGRSLRGGERGSLGKSPESAVENRLRQRGNRGTAGPAEGRASHVLVGALIEKDKPLHLRDNENMFVDRTKIAACHFETRMTQIFRGWGKDSAPDPCFRRSSRRTWSSFRNRRTAT